MTTTPQSDSPDLPGLFAAPEPVPSTKRRRACEPAPVRQPVAAESNDLDLIASVLRTAQRTGYVLVGDGEQVWRWVSRQTRQVERVGPPAAGVVAQLLRRGLLARGGHQRIRRGRHEASARSVLVPASTRAMTGRWGAYHRPTGGAGPAVVPATTEPAPPAHTATSTERSRYGW